MKQATQPRTGVYDSSTRTNRLLVELRDLYEYRSLITNLTARAIKVRYKRSILGIIWTALDPLLTMIVMYLVFSQLFVRGIENYSVYLLTGLVVWNFFSQSTMGAIREFSTSGRLISRVYVPSSTFVIVAILSALVNFFIALVELLLLILVVGSPVNLMAFEITLPLLSLVVFCLGLGFLLSPLEVFFSDIGNFYQIGLRLLMYFSAIMYQVEHLPAQVGNLVKLNPIYGFITLIRQPLYFQESISWGLLGYVSIWSLLMFAVGVFAFIRLSDKVALKL